MRIVDLFGLNTIDFRNIDKLVKKNDVIILDDETSYDEITITNETIDLQVNENPADKILTTGLSIAFLATQIDSPLPGSGDIAGVTLFTAGVVWLGYEILQQYKEHDANARPSTKGVHEKGESRKKKTMVWKKEIKDRNHQEKKTIIGKDHGHQKINKEI